MHWGLLLLSRARSPLAHLCRTAFLLILLLQSLAQQLPTTTQPPKRSPSQSRTTSHDSAPLANFIDVAEKSGLTMMNVFGGKDTKKYIIETTGTGVAIFDYDNDGWPDIF